MLSVDVVKALASEKRLQILHWLKQPRAHFPPQVDGDLVKDGVCGLFIAQKLGVSQPTASEHLRILTQAGLLGAKRRADISTVVVVGAGPFTAHRQHLLAMLR